MTLAVTGAPDSHRGPVFLAGPYGQRGPDCPDVLFCRFPHRFRDFYEGFGCFRLSFGPRGPSARGGSKAPRGGAHLPPSLGYVPGYVILGDTSSPIFSGIRPGFRL